MHTVNILFITFIEFLRGVHEYADSICQGLPKTQFAALCFVHSLGVAPLHAKNEIGQKNFNSNMEIERYQKFRKCLESGRIPKEKQPKDKVLGQDIPGTSGTLTSGYPGQKLYASGLFLLF